MRLLAFCSAGMLLACLPVAGVASADESVDCRGTTLAFKTNRSVAVRHFASPGTVASLEAVRDVIRADRASGRLAKGERAEVILRDGWYRLERPLSLDGRDAGTTWCAEHSGKAVLSGALELTDWRPVASEAVRAQLQAQVRDRVLEAKIPGTDPIPSFASAGLCPPWGRNDFPLLLFAGGRRLPCARWPNGDAFARTEDCREEPGADHAKTAYVTCAAMPRPAELSREGDLWAFGLWNYEWADFRMPVRSVDVGTKTIAVDARTDWFGFRANRPFCLFNALCEIDEPGEWAIDRAARMIRYLPADGEGDRPVLAATDRLIVVKGTEDIVLTGLSFEHSRVTAVSVTDSRRVFLQASTVAHTGGSGVEIVGGSDCRVEGCDLYDLGEGGVFMKGGDARTLCPGGHVAENNHIHHYGQYTYNYRAGVRTEGVGNAVVRNLIHHARHGGVCFDGNDHRIAYNVLHDTCSYNDDAGAIYTCARDFSKRGNVIEYNLVHMTGKPRNPRHCDAIYIDDYTSGTVIRGNLVNRATRGIHIGGGQGNVAERNVIVNCLMGIHLDSRVGWPEAKKREVFEKLDRQRERYAAEPWRTRYPDMLRLYEFEDPQMRMAALYNVFTDNVLVGCATFAKDDWARVRPHTVISNCLEFAVDPGFRDYGRFDWNVATGAVRDVIGTLPLDRIGLYESPCRASPAVRFGAGLTPPRPVGAFEYIPAQAALHFVCMEGLPDGVAQMATNCVRCNVPAWSRGKRVVCCPGAVDDVWREFSFSFVPTADVTVRLDTMGERGEKTLYDDIRMTGADLRDGGFESGEAWTRPVSDSRDVRAPYCNLKPPFGVLTEAEAGCAPAEGKRMGCGNDMLMLSQVIRLKRGVPVKVSFKARSLPGAF